MRFSKTRTAAIDMPIISKNLRLRYPEHFQIGEGSIVDDFSYFSVKVKVGVHSHIASGCSIAGGMEFTFSLGDFSSLSSGTKIWCTSNNFAQDLIMIYPSDLELTMIRPVQGDVVMENYTGTGSNTVIMPNNTIPEGSVIGALSFVPSAFEMEPWSVYAGTPVKKVGIRNKKIVMQQVAIIRKHINGSNS